ncbi:Methyltransferase type 11 [Desulfofundulus kuznetsovii DSM 6115]|uniref:Methyltransferase type 11 n=1 Tax=Desulfofundulus kuznetsovii (strain DSM 6115 / VKM B-1805 / 17) TaxID=760568 RepID=A0AAU8PQJ3_DESK7|nr:Methyltransferase type 11 [Desulfofundulus kuznetsovii DSM 6115]
MKVANVVQEYWNKEGARLYDKIHYINKDKFKNTLLNYLDVEKDCIILDFGTGTGFLASILAELGYKRIIGLDINEYMLLRAKQKLSGFPVMLVRGDGLNLPLKDNSVDAVVSRWVLWVMPDPERAIKEMIRVTKPGGKVITFESSNYDDKEKRLTLKKLVKQLHTVYITLLTGASPFRTKRFWEKTKGKLPMYSLDRYVQFFEQLGLKAVEKTAEEEYGTTFARLFYEGFKFSLIKGVKPNLVSHVLNLECKEWGENELLRILACSECYSNVRIMEGNGLVCEGCKKTFLIKGGIPDLLPAEDKLL